MEDRRGRGLVTCGKGVGLNWFMSLPFLMCRWSVDIKESVWGWLKREFCVCVCTHEEKGTRQDGAFKQGSTA